MTLEFVDLVTKAGGFMLSIAAMIYAWFMSRRKDVDERIGEVAKAHAELEGRVAKIENLITAMPGKDDMHRLEMTLMDMGGDMKAMRATMKAMSESLSRTEGIVSRHEDHLRENH